MRKVVEYKGKTIEVDTYSFGRGFQWAYQIDTGPIREGRDRPHSIKKLILNDVIQAAKREIDHID